MKDEEAKMRKTVCALVGVVILMVTAGFAFAADGNEVLKKVDEVQSASKDSVGDITMTLVEKGGASKVRTMKVWRRHYKDKDDWSLLKFTAPADIKNLGFLSLADDKMYLYLPAFDRVRRIASHARKESFAGSDLSNDDLSTGSTRATTTRRSRRKRAVSMSWNSSASPLPSASTRGSWHGWTRTTSR